MFDRKPMTTGEMVFTGVTLAATFGFMAWVINKTTKVSEEAMKRKEDHLDRAEKIIADIKNLAANGVIIGDLERTAGPGLRVIRCEEEDS